MASLLLFLSELAKQTLISIGTAFKREVGLRKGASSLPHFPTKNRIGFQFSNGLRKRA